jgi:hypothetical protein
MRAELISHTGEILLPRSASSKLVRLEVYSPVQLEIAPQDPAAIRLLTTIDVSDINEAFRQAKEVLRDPREGLNNGTGNDYY